MAWDSLLTITDTVTATATSDAIEVNSSQSEPLEIRLDVSNVSGTSPILDIVVEGSDDNATFEEISAIPQITQAVVDKRFGVITDKKYIRLKYETGGTSPSFDVQALAR
ncbi:hypothetical protein [Halobacillus ihumii]|uniref:hypothetical protein n=1 Tax=Halobacillus ihumii TaxID=2686092 RepID=UPI0013D1DDDF|nr:hypothetical protein [Halobacillus ihumii]